MPLLGDAAMLLSFDIVPDAIAEHDDWHSHEHLRERLSIPGFLRGTRWVAVHGAPRYFMLYEVESLATLTSAAYLQRLDHPSPWTSKMMAHYRGMSRGFCTVSGSFGTGIGHFGRLIRFRHGADAATPMREWLRSALPLAVIKPGLCSAHLLEGALTPPMTREQRIRGADAGVDWAVLVTGYEQAAVSDIDACGLGTTALERHGATGIVEAIYRVAHSVSQRDLGT